MLEAAVVFIGAIVAIVIGIAATIIAKEGGFPPPDGNA